MAKIVKRSVPSSVIPLNERTWLLQPVVVTTMRNDYDVVQTRILVSIMEKMQDALQKIVSNECPAEQLSLFTDTDFGDEVGADEILLNIGLREFGSDARKYGTLKEALKRLVSIPIEMKVENNGKSFTQLAGLCEAYIEDKPRVSNVKIKIKKKVALKLLDTKAQGYHKYLKDVVFSTRNKYVQRFYMFISSWRNSGQSPTVKVLELRRWLRLEDKYPRWNMFYDKVIAPAREEIQARAEAGEVDCYFTVDKVYAKGKRCGEPESLRFNIIISDAGRAYMGHNEALSQKIAIKNFLKSNLMQTPSNTVTIAKRINDGNMQQFNTYLVELSEKAKSNGDKIRDLCSWAYTCCMRWLDDDDQMQQAITNARNEELLSVDSQEVVKETQKATEMEQIIHSEEDRQLWISFLAEIASEMTNHEYLQNFASAITLYSIEPTSLTVLAVNRFVYETIEERYLPVVRRAIHKVFGEGVGLNYRIANP